jgi:hypothetical protein
MGTWVKKSKAPGDRLGPVFCSRCGRRRIRHRKFKGTLCGMCIRRERANV